MSYYVYSNHLAHHGILGMKWGKRNGPPYPLDENDHSKSEKEAGWKKSLSNVNNKITNAYVKSKENEYYNTGYTKENAHMAAVDKSKIMKRVAIGAGIVVGASVAAYVARQYGVNIADDVIKAGTTIQTLAADPDRMSKGKAFYTAFKDSDKIMYEGLFGAAPDGTMKNVIQAIVDKNIRIAGGRVGEKVFKELMSSDSTFAAKAQEYISMAKLGLLDVSDSKKSDYEIFNTYALLDHANGSNLQEKFYKRLKELGYGAIADVNDRKYSGYNTRAAIIFDRGNIRKTISGALDVKVSRLNSYKQVQAYNKAMAKQFVNALLQPQAVGLFGIGAIGATSWAVDKRNDKKYREKQ